MLSVSEATTKFQTAISHFEAELSKLRAGRPNPDMFANIPVEAYGSSQPLQNLANINVVDATLVTVQAWDKGVVGDILKAIQADLRGYNPNVAETTIRIPIPTLTQERRIEIVKEVRKLAEESKIQIRQIRQDCNKYLDSQKDAGIMPEDQHTREAAQLQSEVEKSNNRIDEIAGKKEEALMQV